MRGATSRFDAVESRAEASVAAHPPAVPGLLLFAVGLTCGIFGIAAWILYVWVFRGEAGQDWMVFYTAARAYHAGNLPIIFDGRHLTAAINERFSGWLASPLVRQPWVYPPSFLLLFLPFGVLPPALSVVLFQIAGLIAALAAVWAYVGRAPVRWMMAASLLLCPAVPFNVMTGQNAFFSSALLIGGFALIGRYPAFGGALLGILTFKPQMWLMVPIALVAVRQWRALAGVAAASLLIALVSLAVFGTEAWRAWFDFATGASSQYRAWVIAGRLNGVSVYACASLLGAPDQLASLFQAAAIAIAGGFVYWSFRRQGVGPLPLAALLAATILAAPHVSTSDAVLLGLAASLFLSVVMTDAFWPIYAIIAVAVWLCPLASPPSVVRLGLSIPVLLVIFLSCVVVAIRGKRAAAAMSTPSPA